MNELHKLQYTPPTTRAVMSRLGCAPTVRFGARAYRLPPESMPGELAWRAEFIDLMIERTFRKFLPYKSGQLQALVSLADWMSAYEGLQEAEATYICESTWVSLQDLSQQERDALLPGNDVATSGLESSMNQLMLRFEQMAAQYGQRVDEEQASTRVRRASTPPCDTL